jgi:hypothetical protein
MLAIEVCANYALTAPQFSDVIARMLKELGLFGNPKCAPVSVLKKYVPARHA